MPSLNVIFNGNAKPLERELDRLKTIPGKLTSMFAGLVGVAGFSSLVKDTINWADNLRNVADNLRVNVEWLQKMQNGAMLTGASLNDVSKLISSINKSRQIAIQRPGQGVDQSFKRLGFSESDIRNLNTQQFVEKLISAFKNGATTQAANDLWTVGGKSARNLIAAFSQQFQSDIPILTEQVVDQLANLDDSLRSLKTTLMVDIAPSIVSVSNALQKFLGWLRQVGSYLGAVSSNSGANNRNQIAEAILREARVARWTANLGRPLTDQEKYLIGQIQSGSRAIIESANRNTPGQAALDSEEAEKQRSRAIAEGEKAAQKLRHQLEAAAPDFQVKPIKPEKLKDLHGDLTENQKAGAYALPGAVTLVDVTKSMDRKLGALLGGVLEIRDRMEQDSDDGDSF